MSTYQNPSEKLSALQEKLNGWKEELRDDMGCIPRLEEERDEYKSVAEYLQGKLGEMEDDLRALVQYRLKYERSLTSPGLIAVMLSYLLTPFCLGASFIRFSTRRTRRAADEAHKYSEGLLRKAVVNTNIRANKSLYALIMKNLDPGLRKLIDPTLGWWRSDWGPWRISKTQTWPFSAAYLTVLSMLLLSVADLVFGCFPSWLVPSESIITALKFLPMAPSESMFYGLLVFTLPYLLGDSGDDFTVFPKLIISFVALLLGLLLLQALHWLPVGVNAVYYLIAGLYLVAFLIFRYDCEEIHWLNTWRENRSTSKIKAYGSEEEIYGLIRDALTAELNFWNVEIEDKESLIESTQSTDIPNAQNTIKKLQGEIDVENARWEGMSAVEQLAEIKAVEEIKTLKKKQKNDDLVAKELIEASERQTAAAEEQAEAARDAADTQEYQTRAQTRALQDLADSQQKAANRLLR